MFRRPHHQYIASVLESLNAELLLALRCYFGGGTAIALRHGEYRESVDMNFMTSDTTAYRELRSLAKGSKGMAAFFSHIPSHIQLVPGPRIDQYGIRAIVIAFGSQIKFEIIYEGRIQLDDPNPEDKICGVSCLTSVDMAATKLLANSDRWADPGVFSRDLIDLAMMQADQNLLVTATAKAELAYGACVRVDLIKSLNRLLERPDWLERCMNSMRIELPPVELINRLMAIERWLGAQTD